MRRVIERLVEVKIHLRDTDKQLVSNWRKYFRTLSEVEISYGNILDIKATAVVSPTNSFGIMGGGVDLLYRDKFGLDVEALVQKSISSRFHGELPVGSALPIPLHGQNFKYLISAPTTRLPMNIDGTLNAYLAFRAALLIAKNKNFKSIACPGLCVGQMCQEMIARQMLVAYVSVVLERIPKDINHVIKQMNWMLSCSQNSRLKGA